jgi:hypothetical protein
MIPNKTKLLMKLTMMLLKNKDPFKLSKKTVNNKWISNAKKRK